MAGSAAEKRFVKKSLAVEKVVDRSENEVR